MVLSASGRAFFEGLHFGGGEGARLAKWSIGIAITSTLAVAALLVAGLHSVVVLAPLGVLNLTFVLVSWPRRPRVSVDRKLKRSVWLFVTLAMVGTLASSGFSQATVLVAGWANNMEYVGQYAAALTLTTPLMLVSAALSSVLFPALSAGHVTRSAVEVRARLGEATSLLITVLVGVSAVLIPVAGSLIELLWGRGFEAAKWIILFLIPVATATAVAVPSVTVITSKSNKGMLLSAASSLSGAAVGVVVWMVLIPVNSELAIPLGFAVGSLIVSAIPTVLAWVRYRMRWLGDFSLAWACLALALNVAVLGQAREFPFWQSFLFALVILCVWVLVRRRSVAELARRLRPALFG
ncbi:lipopolysaccharide biosynthesis protein [Sediminivirga luteola]|uniref:lipopolysaccharide biosynthesis protein n=1 Tax=Sediminivirga luteola TaxID=1774748 RepID=UPI001F584B5D|nr:hypothetical protein [Sediminivirga luteola]MCI2266958.1 hypothetical protein [Sediminivirga luteola]